MEERGYNKYGIECSRSIKNNSSMFPKKFVRDYDDISLVKLYRFGEYDVADLLDFSSTSGDIATLDDAQNSPQVGAFFAKKGNFLDYDHNSFEREKRTLEKVKKSQKVEAFYNLYDLQKPVTEHEQ